MVVSGVDSPEEVSRVDLAADSLLILRSRAARCPVSPAAEADSEEDSEADSPVWEILSGKVNSRFKH